MATIAQLAERQAKLEAELSALREEIAARAGETDETVRADKAAASKVKKG